MCCRTESGTRPAIDSPRARRSRIAVDDTSAVGASSRMIDVSRRLLVERRPHHPAGERGQTLRHLGDPMARTSDHGEMRVVEDGRIVHPAHDVGKRVGADDEVQLGRRVARSVQLLQRRRRERPRVVAKLEVRRSPAWPPSHRQRHHREAVITRRGRRRPVRRHVRGDDERARSGPAPFPRPTPPRDARSGSGRTCRP